jgi:DNA repair protein RecO (recombination protein O)
MPTRTAEAFVLDSTASRERDKIVTLFTETEGKLRGLAHGAARSVRRFGGRLERLSRVRITYFEKEGRDLVRIDDLELRQESFSLHQDLTVAAAASYISEVAGVFVREKEADRRYFRLLGATVDGLRAGVNPDLLLRYFEFWTARLHGIFPSLEACDACGRTFGSSGARMSAQGQAALCARCSRATGGRNLSLDRAALTLLEAFRRASPTESANVVYSAGAIRGVEAAVGAVLIAFTGHDFKSAPFLRQVMAEGRR